MKESPNVSSKPHFFIVTPSFNQAQFILQTIETIAKQNYPTTHLVMDGGSTDGTVQLLKQQKNPNLFWVSAPDKGQSDALNKGLQKIAKLKPKPNDIVAYLNSDDYYLPDCFATVTKLFASQPSADWLVGDAVIVDEQNQEIQTAIRLYKKLWRHLLSPTLLAVLNPIPQPAVFLRWSAFEKTGEFSEELHYTMDYEYWHRLYKSVGKPLVISQPLSAFRIHGTSKGGSQYEKQFKEELSVAQHFTNNSTLLFFHKLHNHVITNTYKLVK